MATPREQSLNAAEAHARVIALEQIRIDNYRVPKTPRFFRDDPTLVFMQVEAIFNNSRITDNPAKSDHVIAALDCEIIVYCRNLIANHDDRSRALY